MSIYCTITVYWLSNFTLPITCMLCDRGNGGGYLTGSSVITQNQGILRCFTGTATNSSFSGISLIFTHGIGPVRLTFCVDRASCISHSKRFRIPQNTMRFRRPRLYSADECSIFFACDNI